MCKVVSKEVLLKIFDELIIKARKYWLESGADYDVYYDCDSDYSVRLIVYINDSNEFGVEEEYQKIRTSDIGYSVREYIEHPFAVFSRQCAGMKWYSEDFDFDIEDFKNEDLYNEKCQRICKDYWLDCVPCFDINLESFEAFSEWVESKGITITD